MSRPLFQMSSRNCGRAARECEIKWMGERHPSINRTQWSQPEINRCRELMDAYHLQHGPGVAVDWVWIAGELKVTSSKSFRSATAVFHIQSD